MPNRHRSRLNGVATVLVPMLTLALLAACAPQPAGDVTPTPRVQTVQPTATAAPPTTAPATPLPTLAPTPTLSGPPILYLEPSVVEFTVGQTQRVQVLLENVQGVHSVELHIGFEPRHLSVEDANPDVGGVQVETGSLPTPGQVMKNEVDNDTGVIIYYAAQAEGSPTGRRGTVASFTLRALAEGVIPLRFTVAKLYDSGGQPLPPIDKQVDGLVIISAGDTGAAPTPPPASAPPPTAPVGGEEWETVQSGETLYQVCRRHCPHRWSPDSATFDADLKTYAEQVAQLNNLGWPDPVIQPGQRLQMPACP